jgi:hypothetical protein
LPRAKRSAAGSTASPSRPTYETSCPRCGQRPSRFAQDSSLEGDGFEPSVPRRGQHFSRPPRSSVRGPPFRERRDRSRRKGKAVPWRVTSVVRAFDRHQAAGLALIGYLRLFGEEQPSSRRRRIPIGGALYRSMTKPRYTPVCRGPGCTSSDLIEAHIIPKSFGRLIRSPVGANVTVTMDRASQKNPLGVFDSRILCAICDGHINNHYDQPAFDFFKQFRLRLGDVNMRRTRFTRRGVNCDMLCGFFLSVLWRASISTRPECSLTLGPYEDEARDVLFGRKPLSSFAALEVMVQRYRSNTIPVDQLYTLPALAPFGELNAYGFSLAGYRVTAKIDPRPLPPSCKPYTLNRKNVLRGFFVDFEDTPEFAGRSR